MSIKLAVLKSGEHVIADIKELVDENERVVSLVFLNPYVVNLLTPQILYEENSVTEAQHKVSFYPWIALSRDKEMAVDPSWVVTIVEPQEMVKSSYESKMTKSVDGVMEDKNLDNVDSEFVNGTLIENFEVITEEKDGN